MPSGNMLSVNQSDLSVWISGSRVGVKPAAERSLLSFYHSVLIHVKTTDECILTLTLPALQHNQMLLRLTLLRKTGTVSMKLNFFNDFIWRQKVCFLNVDALQGQWLLRSFLFVGRWLRCGHGLPSCKVCVKLKRSGALRTNVSWCQTWDLQVITFVPEPQRTQFIWGQSFLLFLCLFNKNHQLVQPPSLQTYRSPAATICDSVLSLESRRCKEKHGAIMFLRVFVCFCYQNISWTAEWI